MLLGNCSGGGGDGGDHQLEVGSSGMNRGGGGGGDGDDGVQLKKGPWTAAEDAILTEYVRKHGEGNWNAVQRNTGLARCGKSCRLRWANHLRPNLKKGAFSPEEERLIVELHAQLGNKWARMAAQLPGRTDNEIKNYWNTRVKRRHRQGLPLYPPEIQLQQLHHPQSSHSPHSYHSQPSTPTTPISSFSFQTTTTPVTTPTGGHHCHLSPSYYSQCHSPTPLSPSPSPLSPNMQSPHHPSFPTLPLFDTNNNNNNNNNASNANLSFSIRRTPPLLQTPPRFKRFHSDPGLTDLGSPVANSINSNNNNINTNINNNNNNNNINSFGSNNFQGTSSSFSLPFSPYLRSPSSPSLAPSPQSNCNASPLMNPTNRMLSLPSFSSLPVCFSTPNSSLVLLNPDEKDCILSPGSVFGLKPELPSNQLLSQNGNAEMCFDNEKISVSCSGSGLLEDLLEEAQALAGNYGESSRRVSDDQKREVSGFNQWSDSSFLNLSSELKPKEEAGGQMNTMHEDLTKLLNVIPSMQVPEWYSDSGEASNCQSSVVTDDNIGLEMQQIASMLRVDSTPDHVRPSGSCSYDNLPGIC